MGFVRTKVFFLGVCSCLPQSISFQMLAPANLIFRGWRSELYYHLGFVRSVAFPLKKVTWRLLDSDKSKKMCAQYCRCFLGIWPFSPGVSCVVAITDASHVCMPGEVVQCCQQVIVAHERCEACFCTARRQACISQRLSFNEHYYRQHLLPPTLCGSKGANDEEGGCQWQRRE